MIMTLPPSCTFIRHNDEKLIVNKCWSKHGFAYRPHIKHGIAIALANAFERPSTRNHFGLPLSTVCVVGIHLCHLTSILTWNCI